MSVSDEVMSVMVIETVIVMMGVIVIVMMM